MFLFEKASKRRFPVEISPWQWPDQDWFKENELAGVKIREKLEKLEVVSTASDWINQPREWCRLSRTTAKNW